ncbi:uncharacterized protein BKA55DRAFT_218759 [Fusarium redolens]|uniref:Zn(2)-C6 fungal-type domain-containing protein n=1 Tax=Fusarium redolens TaxID=48865 RepID=A0A9P9FXQ4_FUSRE|nr:uncharacterized protein BKA55DRAFT_218759 [Fusarium redolens]KAH7216974.1 hypothetical protein BKA55DRAFT_218759 [Fusarium redolens]
MARNGRNMPQAVVLPKEAWMPLISTCQHMSIRKFALRIYDFLRSFLAMADQTIQQTQRRPHGVACTPCRRAKMKCVTSNPASVVCDRCQRLGRQCVFESHRRGLWRRDMSGRR